jgi:hypothetical protein
LAHSDVTPVLLQKNFGKIFNVLSFWPMDITIPDSRVCAAHSIVLVQTV